MEVTRCDKICGNLVSWVYDTSVLLGLGVLIVVGVLLALGVPSAQGLHLGVI